MLKGLFAYTATVTLATRRPCYDRVTTHKQIKICQ